jgi:DHA1 family tetracycline resistance protein-like MFS transporter
MPPATPQTFSPPPISKHAFTFILVTVLLDMIGYGIIIPVLPQLIEVVGEVTLAEAAIIGGWMGNLSDRFGRRPLLLIAIFGLGADFLLQAFAPNLLWLYIGRIISGICGGSWIIANAYIADVTPPEGRAKAFGIMGAAFGIGFVIGPAIGGMLGEYGPRMPFYAAAAFSLLNFVYGYFVLPESLPPSNRRKFEITRSNPFGAFQVFQSYSGVIPLCILLFSFFFFTSAYTAIWPYWAIAKFGWSTATIGLTLAAFGLIAAVFQGGLSGPGVKYFGEYKVVLIGLVSSAVAALGYGLAGSLTMVIVVLIIHGPEGFIHPMLTAVMSKTVPEDAQGELQGGISAITNISMLLGTVFSAQIFGYFMSDRAPFKSPDVAFYIVSAGMTATLFLYLWLVDWKEERQK